MTNTINLELSKRLAPYLKGIETEYIIRLGGKYKTSVINGEDGEIEVDDSIILKSDIRIADGKIFDKGFTKAKRVYYSFDFIPTLNLKEAIELLPYQIQYKYDNWGLCITKDGKKYIVEYDIAVEGETLLQAIEKMLEYLLDNNLLPND